MAWTTGVVLQTYKWTETRTWTGIVPRDVIYTRGLGHEYNDKTLYHFGLERLPIVCLSWALGKSPSTACILRSQPRQGPVIILGARRQLVR